MVKSSWLPSGDYSGKSLRVGSVNFLVNHPGCDLFHAIVRGGWEFSSSVRIFEYVMMLNLTVSIGGRALSGWNQTRYGAKCPRLIFLECLEP